MADPRADVDFDGIGDKTATFKYDGTIIHDVTKQGGAAQVGKAVTMTGNRQVGLAGDGDRIKGRLQVVEKDGHCSVQFAGGCTLPKGDGAVVTNGSRIVGDLGPGGAADKGYIRNAVAGTDLVAGEDSKAAHEVVDASPAANIKVILQG
jgi:hypothetical protein